MIVYLVANTTVYTGQNSSISGASGGDETTYSYTMYAGTAQVDQETMALPSVGDQPTGGSSDTVITIDDLANRPIWQKDADGNISYAAYDPATSAVTVAIQDVSSAQLGHNGVPSSLPTGWSFLSGSHLDLITTYQVDGLGRVFEETDPDHDATFTVYDDPDHEVRTYIGWIDDGGGEYSQESDGLPPTVVTIDNLVVPKTYFPSTEQTGTYSETFAMYATPHPTDGVPDGTEGIADITALSLTISNQAGQAVETDAYYNPPSISGEISDGHVGANNILAGFDTTTGVQLGTLWIPGTTSTDQFYATKYQYDTYGNLDGETTPDLNITRWVYDSLDRLASVWVGTNDTSGSYIGHYWSPANSSSVGNMVETTSYQYDNGGTNIGDSNLTRIIGFEDSTLTITPHVTQLFYDWEDELVATKQGVLLDDYYADAAYPSLGDEQPYVEYTSGETPSALDAQLPITYYTLDNLGEVTEKAVYNGDDVPVETSSAGVPEVPTTGLVTDTAYVYDARGRVQETTLDGYEENYYTKYDGNGNVLSSTDPLGNVTSYVYDGAGRETEMIAPNPSTGAASGGLATTYGYDADGNQTSVEDPMSNFTTYAFDAAGRETAMYEPIAGSGASGGPETTYAYDTAGNLQTLTDPDSYATTYSHDALGRETESSENVAETSSVNVPSDTYFTYDGDNNVVEKIDANTLADVYTYNDLDQQIEEQWYASSSLGTATNTITTTYDLSGDVLTAIDTYPTADDTQDSSNTFTYNTLGQQVTDDNNGSGASGTTGTAGVPRVVLNSTYDAMGDRLSLAASIASTADFKNTYTFDAMGDETNIIQQSNGGNTVAYKQVFLSYDQDHRLGQLSDYGGPSYEDFALWEYMQYNHDGNLTSFQDYGYDYTGSTGPSSYGGYGYSGNIEMESLSLSYDNDQRLSEIASSISETQNQYNTYDHDSQLSNSSPTGFDSGGTNYGFDNNGNVSGTGDTVGEGDAQLSANGYSYQFDAAGNMVKQTDPSGNVTSYVWDNRGRLSSLTIKNSSLVTLQVVNYTYDAMNQLIGESVSYYSGGTVYYTSTQRFAYDPRTGQMQLAFNGSGNLTDRYLWGPLVDEVLADEKVTSLSYGGTVDWIANDGIGGPTDVWIRGTPNLADHIQYNAFGGIASQTESWNAPLFGYDGEYTDPATGMQYHSEPNSGMRGRWYLPWSERWASKDPIFPFSGSNPYEFCNNDPMNLIDPSGLGTISAGLAGDASILVGERGSAELTLSWDEPWDVSSWAIGVTETNGQQFAVNPELSGGFTFGYADVPRPEYLDGLSGSMFMSVGEGVGAGFEVSNLTFPDPSTPKWEGYVEITGKCPEPANGGVSRTQTRSASISVGEYVDHVSRPVKDAARQAVGDAVAEVGQEIGGGIRNAIAKYIWGLFTPYAD